MSRRKPCVPGYPQNTDLRKNTKFPKADEVASFYWILYAKWNKSVISLLLSTRHVSDEGNKVYAASSRAHRW